MTLPAQSTPAKPQVEKLFQETRPLVIAHRGYSTMAPENTIPALEFGVKAGADLVELDYHHTRDGAPIVIHDATLDRTTNGDELWNAQKVRVDSKTAAELQTLDAGAWFKPPFQGLKLPLLEAAVAAIQKEGVTLIERKAGDAKTCVELMRKNGWINQAMVQAFDWSYLEDYHKLEPTQILGALGPPSTYEGKKLTTEEKVLSPIWIDRLKKTGAKAVVWNSQVTAEAVKHAQSKGLKVWVYTIDDPKKAEELLDIGIDGIITNNPSLIWRTIALRTRK
ncbi:MAG: glycerophosphodiester phosphodiesterase [Verrucomicrobiales bacterium]